MKLIMAIINSDDTRNVLDRLARRGFSATVTSTTGGFLPRRQYHHFLRRR